MVALILGMLICVGLALAVVALVAVPARRDGRDILTPKGEEVVSALKDRQSSRQRHERADEESGVATSSSSTDVDGVQGAAEHISDVAPQPVDAAARS